MLLSHVRIGISDFDRAFAFYSGMMDKLGLTFKFSEPENSWAGWMEAGTARPLFLIGRPFDSDAAHPGNGQMVALLAPNRNGVDQCHAQAIGSGGIDEGAPASRPHYHPDYHGACFSRP